MGLDMYLSARRYLSVYKEEDKEILEVLDNIDVGQNGMKVKEIVYDAMYWRKANAIHRWFVQHCQSGIDDCREAYVPTDLIRDLVHDCEITLKNKGRAKELMPTQEGFFFGSTDIDDGYFEDLQNTVDTLKPLLERQDINNFDFYYRASW